MKARFLLVAIIAFMAGALTTKWAFYRSHSGGVEVAVVVPKDVAKQPTQARVAAKDGGMSSERVAGDSVSFLKQLEAFQRKNMLHYNMIVFDADQHLSKKAKIMFQISDDEAQALNDLMDETKQKITEICLQSATATVDADKRKIVIQVPPFPEQGEGLYEETKTRLNGILGPERSSLLDQIGQMENLFQEFGVGVRKITVQRIPKSGKNPTLTVLVEEQTQADFIEGEGVRYNTSASSADHFYDRSSLVKKIGPLAEKWVPEDF